jgi:polar amino acid transport system permease protein
MFKDTPLLSAITVLELLSRAKLLGAAEFRYLEPLTLVGVLLLAISLVASRLLRGLEHRQGTAQSHGAPRDTALPANMAQ